jgi:hypothetical protein
VLFHELPGNLLQRKINWLVLPHSYQATTHHF